jgi:hypothetical protein
VSTTATTTVTFKPLEGEPFEVEVVKEGKTFYDVKLHDRIERYHRGENGTVVESSFAKVMEPKPAAEKPAESPAQPTTRFKSRLPGDSESARRCTHPDHEKNSEHPRLFEDAINGEGNFYRRSDGSFGGSWCGECKSAVGKAKREGNGGTTAKPRKVHLTLDPEHEDAELLRRTIALMSGDEKLTVLPAMQKADKELKAEARKAAKAAKLDSTADDFDSRVDAGHPDAESGESDK